MTAKTNIWFGVAGTIEDLKGVAAKLDEEGTPHARTLRDRIQNSIPRFEAGEEKRKRRDYRLARKAAFSRPEPGFSLYEGRTRGKKIKYTFSDDEEDYSDSIGVRRSVRQSGISTPAETGPVVTSSGRQVKPRHTGIYGESILTDQRKEIEAADAAQQMEIDQPDGDEESGPATTTSTGRPQRSKAAAGSSLSRTNGMRGGHSKPDNGYNSIDDMDEESDAVSDEHDWEAEDEEEDEPDLGDDESEGNDEDEEDSAREEQDVKPSDGGTPDSLVVQLRYRGGEDAPPTNDVQVLNENQRDGGKGGAGASNGVKEQPQQQQQRAASPGDTIELVNGNQARTNGQSDGASKILPASQKPSGSTTLQDPEPTPKKPDPADSVSAAKEEEEETQQPAVAKTNGNHATAGGIAA